MRPLVCLLISLVGFSSPVVSAESAPPSPAPQTRKHTSSLTFKNGTYTSIFGIVPKEYKLESEETREIILKKEDESTFTLMLVASETRRILSIPDETPSVESAPKLLTGKTLRVTRAGEKWDFEVVGNVPPSEEETREAQRLITRYQPGASPFIKLPWTPEGTAAVDVVSLLVFLGYTHVSELHGSAQVKRSTNDPSGPLTLDVDAIFQSGEMNARISVELKASGTLLHPEEAAIEQKLRLDGQLNIHGERNLPDGRKVPYSLITEFKYETVSASVPGA